MDNLKPAEKYRQLLNQYRQEVEDELDEILLWWLKYMPDENRGGFFGTVDNLNIADTAAEKGIVLNSRILWTFSEAAISFNNKEYKRLAKVAYQYIVSYFKDSEFGGVYWSVSADGSPLNQRKQIYGLAFTVYALSSYYLLTEDSEALSFTQSLYKDIEKYSRDKERGGYIEAFAKDWSPIADVRLSDKDDNLSKTMNTHLHIVEAYANLYKVWPSNELKESIISILNLFEEHIIDQENNCLHLFFDANWVNHSSHVSFGHDIEAAWLLYECAQIVKDEKAIRTFSERSLRLTNGTLKAWDKIAGGLWYEWDIEKERYIKEKHWWPQAEAMVGFFNAFEISGEEVYLLYSLDSFRYIQKEIKNNESGEWFWGRDEKGNIIEKEKAGFWKCPYHNSRACMEMMKRIDYLLRYE